MECPMKLLLLLILWDSSERILSTDNVHDDFTTNMIRF
jgi:hypothetical protein